MAQPADLLLSDYAGHAFSYELAIDLSAAGSPTSYSYCSTNVAPKGSLDADKVRLYPVSSGRSFDKYNLPRRLLAEIRYGLGAARVTWSVRPRIHMVSNMPLVSLLVIWLMTLPLHNSLVVWFQDVQSGLASGILGDGTVARLLSRLESFLLRRADHVIAISPELGAEAERRGVRAEHLGIVENWAPIEEIPVKPRSNSWSTVHGLESRTVFLYSGTLARKHNPTMLVELARATKDIDGVVVLVSEGEGATQIASMIASDADLTNLLILPYQPFADLPDVLASADVLVVLLEPLAGSFSVPSKTLSYLCAGRPILAAMPSDNTAARTITDRAKAGIVVEPGDSEGFCAAAVELSNDPARRQELGASGRTYAELRFASPVVVEAMQRELERAL